MNTTHPSPPQDPAQILIDDHRIVERMFRTYHELGADEYHQKRELAIALFSTLDIHAEIEEEIFYPAMSEGEDGLTEEVAQSREEHAIMKTLIEELRTLDPERDQETFTAKMRVLMENVMHHIEEEERTMLPDTDIVLNSQTEEIAKSMLKLKEKLQAAYEE